MFVVAISIRRKAMSATSAVSGTRSVATTIVPTIVIPVTVFATTIVSSIVRVASSIRRSVVFASRPVVFASIVGPRSLVAVSRVSRRRPVVRIARGSVIILARRTSPTAVPDSLPASSSAAAAATPPASAVRFGRQPLIRLLLCHFHVNLRSLEPAATVTLRHQ